MDYETENGYVLYRDGSVFTVRERRLFFSSETGSFYTEECYHSQLNIFVGLSKRDCKRVLTAWLSHFGDEILIESAYRGVDELFSEMKALPAPTQSDKNMN